MLSAYYFSLCEESLVAAGNDPPPPPPPPGLFEIVSGYVCILHGPQLIGMAEFGVTAEFHH